MTMFNYQCDEDYHTIKDASQNYPQLSTYKEEWLFFARNGYMPGIPVDLEYQTVQTNDTATVLNAIPYQYKSAFLKGNTLVNCINQKDFNPIYATRVETDNGYVYTQNGYNNSTRIDLNYTLNPLLSNDKYYLISFRLKINKQRTLDIVTDGTGYEGYSARFSENTDIFIKAKIKFASNGTRLRIYIRCVNDLDYTDDTFEIRELMLIEYQDGMENWDIPYFEGIQSVKMPVLTTSNKDGTKTNTLTVNEDVTLRSNGDVYDELNLLTGRLTQRIDENNEVLAQEVVKTVDLSVVDQDVNDTKLSTFNDITHVTLSSEGLIPEAELEVATKNEEVLNTMSLEMDDISTTQNALQETSDNQSENVDSTMIATTEIYEGLL